MVVCNNNDMTIQSWLSSASQQLAKQNNPSPRLDAELLLSHAAGKPRSYLLAHPEISLDDLQGLSLQRLGRMLRRRIKREPLAYIIQKKEFFGRDFLVNKDVLIPRPDSEAIIELLQNVPLRPSLIADIGTGSGCLAITAALELPKSQVVATDISPKALQVARKNAASHHATLEFLQGNLLEPLFQNNRQPDVIVANLPYVDKSWHVSPETAFEPSSALFAANNGLALISKLICQADRLLQSNGFLLLEADPRQHQAISAESAQNGFRLSQKESFAIAFQKI